MNFASIIWLYILPIFAIIAIILLIVVYKNYYTCVTQLFSLTTIPKIVVPGLFKIQKVKLLITFIILVLFFIALSGPQWGIKPQQVTTYGVDMIVAIDTSKSMLTEDVTPNRLEFVKRTVQLLLDRVETHRVGIITFAGIAFYHCPLTIDISAAKELVSIIDTDIIPYPGTKIAAALQEALRVFKQTAKTSKVIILFTDGEDHDSSPLSVAEEAKKEEIVIYTVGVGTPEGKPIPIRDTTGKIVDYKKDKQGNIVTSKLNEELLYEIAQITNGRYFSSSYGEFGIAEGILNEISNMKKSETKTKVYNLYKNRYHYFVYLIILLMLIEIFIPKQWYTKL